MTTLESTFSAHLVAALNAPARMTRVERQQSGLVRLEAGHVMHLARKGAADLSGIVGPHGWRLEVEVKAARGTWTKAQRTRKAFVERFGGVYVLVRFDESKGLVPSVLEAVRAIDAAIAARLAKGAA